MTDFVSREQVLTEVWEWYGQTGLYQRIAALPCFPAPNPKQRDGRNVMGQTEDEFWNSVEEMS